MADPGSTDSADAAKSTVTSMASAQTSSAIPPSSSNNTQLTSSSSKAPESTTEYIFMLFAAGRIAPQEYKTVLLGGAFEYSEPCVKGTIGKETNLVRDFITKLRSSSRIKQQEYELFSEIYNAEHFDPRVKVPNAAIQLRFPAKNIKKAVEVFNIPELLHSILEHTDYSHGLTHIKLTCRRFKFTVEDSSILKDRTAFVIRMISPQPRTLLFGEDGYTHKDMEQRSAKISQSTDEAEIDHLIELRCFFDSKFNFNMTIEGLFWGHDLYDGAPVAPPDNTFYFDFARCRQTFADYSTNTFFRSLRVWDDPVQNAAVCFRTGFSEGGRRRRFVAKAPEGKDLTFGDIFDKVARNVPKGCRMVDGFMFKL